MSVVIPETSDAEIRGRGQGRAADLLPRRVAGLTAGQPILVNLADLGGPDVNVVVLLGETERALLEHLRGVGLIPADVAFREAQVGTAEVVRVRRAGRTGGTPES